RLHLHRRRLFDGDRNLVLARQLRFARRLLHLVPAAATAAARTGLIEPDDVGARLFGKNRRAGLAVRVVADHQDEEDAEDDVPDQRSDRSWADALLGLFKREGLLNRMQLREMDGEMARRSIYTHVRRW